MGRLPRGAPAAKPAVSAALVRAVLDHLRTQLAVKVDQLEPAHHDTLYDRSNQNLIPSWAIDEAERYQLERSRVVFVRGRDRGDAPNWTCVSTRSALGQHIRRRAFGTALKTRRAGGPRRPFR
jgi:hypothetical protein